MWRTVAVGLVLWTLFVSMLATAPPARTTHEQQRQLKVLRLESRIHRAETRGRMFELTPEEQPEFGSVDAVLAEAAAIHAGDERWDVPRVIKLSIATLLIYAFALYARIRWGKVVD